MDVEKEEHSSIVGGIAVWKSVWRFLRKLDIVLPEDPAIPLLGVYPEDAPTGKKDTCSTMFIAALFIIDRSLKQPGCPIILSEVINTQKDIHGIHRYVTISPKAQNTHDTIHRPYKA